VQGDGLTAADIAVPVPEPVLVKYAIAPATITRATVLMAIPRFMVRRDMNLLSSRGRVRFPRRSVSRPNALVDKP